MLSRSNLTIFLSISLIICFNLINSKSTNNLNQVLSNTNTKAVTQGDLATTNADAYAEATRGHNSLAVGTATGLSDKVLSQTTAVASANAAKDVDKVVSTAHSEDVAQVVTSTDPDDRNKNIVSINDYKTGTTTTTYLNGSTDVQKFDQVTSGTQKIFATQDQVFKDTSLLTSNLSTETHRNPLLTLSLERDIIINISTKDEKLIVEKIIKDDNRNIIVTASKYVLPSLSKANMNYVQALISGTCNCAAVKNYMIDILSES